MVIASMNRPIRLTVTGFGPFHGVSKNSSEHLVRHLESVQCVSSNVHRSTAVLPVNYRGARRRIESVVAQFRPHILLMTGVAAGTGSLQLEKVARNLDSSDTPDNEKVIRRNQAICTHAAQTQYVSDLPLDRFAAQLSESGIACSVSEDAGGFICNHYYYLAQRIRLERVPPPQCLFIHLPGLQELTRPGASLTFPAIAQAIGRLTEWIAESRSRPAC